MSHQLVIKRLLTTEHRLHNNPVASVINENHLAVIDEPVLLPLVIFHRSPDAILGCSSSTWQLKV